MKPKKFIKATYNGELGLTMCQEWKYKILEHYPEFEEELDRKVGDWVVTKEKNKYSWQDRVVRVAAIEGGRVWIYTKSSSDQKEHLSNKDHMETYRKATKEEIKPHLIEEAKRRGLTDGHFEDLNFGGSPSLFDISEWYYDPSTDKLWTAPSGLGGKLAYHKGKWARPIQTITKEEAEKELGKKII